MQAHTSEPVHLRAADGQVLAATHFLPEGPVRGSVVLASATGVPRRFYAPFAAYLASRGHAVLTFDYRGTGESAPERLRGYQATMAQWGSLDLSAALAWMAGRHPELPQRVVGHSVGGQVLGLVPPEQLEALSGVLLVASQGGYWGMWRGVGLAVMLFTWYALIPGMTALLGYLPMRRFGQGEDRPAGVAKQWARWGRHPGYFLADEEVRSALRRCAATRSPTMRTRRSRACSGSSRATRTRAPRCAACHRRRPGCASSATSASSGTRCATRCGPRPPSGWRPPGRSEGGSAAGVGR